MGGGIAKKPPLDLRIVQDADGTWDVVSDYASFPRAKCESQSRADAERFVADWRAYERGERERPVGFTAEYGLPKTTP